jgi:transcriptional regulator with XRE-family HTH domain
MADGIGVSQASISNYENGRQEMPSRVAQRLIAYAAELGVALTYDEIYAAQYPSQPVAVDCFAVGPELRAGRADHSPPSREKIMSPFESGQPK